jgi:glycosyltransferase involved in cell wall biosynthesis
MKLIVQIPCLNEEETLAATVADIPREIDGIDVVEVLIIDDGSSDGTVEVARAAGVDHIVRHPINRGLGHAFRTGIDACLRLGADIIVNTDADNQYAGADIPRLIEPILRREASVVVGDRQTRKVQHFSFAKRRLQALGSRFVSWLSHLDLPDAVSGYRAISRDVALQLNIISPFSYTIEMLIQAGRKRMPVKSIPVRTNPTTRRSRLFKSIPGFVTRSFAIMVRTYAMYRPLRVFLYVGGLLFAVGLAPIARFLYFFANGRGSGHVQSLVLGGSLVVIGFLTLLIGLIADLISFNRQLLEIALEKLRRLESEPNGSPPSSSPRPPSSGDDEPRE